MVAVIVSCARPSGVSGLPCLRLPYNRTFSQSSKCRSHPSRRLAPTGASTGSAEAVCSPEDRNAAVTEVVLPPSTSEEMLQFEREWVAQQLQAWLDEEWLEQPVHKELSIFASEAYVQLRRSGEDRLGDVVLSLSSDLLAFDYRETFTGAFEVANKVSELLMLKMGIDVCCVSPDDMERFRRVDLSFSED